VVTESRRVWSISLGEHTASAEAEEELALDEPVCIFVNGEYHVTLIATPELREELAAGYLLTQGIIESVEEIEDIEIDDGNVKVELTGAVDLREASVSMMNLRMRAAQHRASVRRDGTEGVQGRGTGDRVDDGAPGLGCEARRGFRSHVDLARRREAEGLLGPPENNCKIKRVYLRLSMRVKSSDSFSDLLRFRLTSILSLGTYFSAS